MPRAKPGWRGRRGCKRDDPPSNLPKRRVRMSCVVAEPLAKARRCEPAVRNGYQWASLGLTCCDGRKKNDKPIKGPARWVVFVMLRRGIAYDPGRANTSQPASVLCR